MEQRGTARGRGANRPTEAAAAAAGAAPQPGGRGAGRGAPVAGGRGIGRRGVPAPAQPMAPAGAWGARPEQPAPSGGFRGSAALHPTAASAAAAASGQHFDPPLNVAPAPSAWGPRPGSATSEALKAAVPAASATPTSGRGTAGIRPGSVPANVQAGGSGRATVHRTGDEERTVPAGRGPAAAAVAAAAVTSDAAGGAGGDPGAGASRGTARGSRVLSDILNTRPTNLATKRGDRGATIALTANYFRLEKSTTWNLYQYRVDFAPNIEVAGLRNRLLSEQKEQLGGYLFDGTIMFIARKLPKDHIEIVTKDREENPVQITLRFVGLVSMNTAASLQVLNLILRRAMGGLKLQLVGRNLFDALAKVDVHEHRLQLWPGYLTSIRQHEQDLMVCAEMSCKVMRTETVMDIMLEVHKVSRNFRDEFQNKVLGMTVLTAYNNKTYRIDDVNFAMTPMSTFPTKDGTQVSFMQYYKDRYNLVIKDSKQPMLLSKVRARDVRGAAGAGEKADEFVALVPELCRATGLSERMRQNFHLMAAISTYTRLTPSDRIAKLNAFNKRLRTTAESAAVLNEWNLQLASDMVQLAGRRFPPENLVMGDGRKTRVNELADWSREFHNQPMFAAVALRNWVCVAPRMCEQETRNFIDVMGRSASGMQYTMGKPHVIITADDRMHSIQRALDDAMNEDPQLIMIVVPNNNADKYSAIKKKCCVERPVATQVMVSRTIKARPGKERNLISVATKVLIQINCKLGGAAWMTEMPGKGIMTIGFDVCHDSSDRSKSYGAMVATMDLKQCSKYFSAVSSHRNGEELSNEFSVNVTKALKEFRAEHGTLPDRILVYRDGVGEGQTDYVFQHEVVVLRKKLDEIYKTAGIATGYRLAFIIVSKRINTRFFERGQNPMPGTVVDDVVTLPERYDFFLVSQSCKVGTTSPTSYNVISDNSGLSPNQLQAFSYKMTHLYYNWTGTLRVPAVCQYAHKLAFLVGQCIHQSPSNLLEKQLYFL